MIWTAAAGKNHLPARRGGAGSCAWSGRRAIIAILLLLSFVLTACAPPAASGPPVILLFNGTGTSGNDVMAVEDILKSRNLSYATVNSSQLNGMSESQLRSYRLLIIPGGHYINMGNSLTPIATANVRRAVQGGLNYLGICAGGLLAGDAPCPSLNLTSGVRFKFYAEVNRGIHQAALPITTVGAPVLDLYWENGPQFTGWGTVVGKYPDGTPAVVQGMSGQGWVILCGVHPEAPENWRHGLKFATPVNAGHAYAATLIEAALHRTSLPHF